MSKNILLISSGTRKNANSDILRDEFPRGARGAGGVRGTRAVQQACGAGRNA